MKSVTVKSVTKNAKMSVTDNFSKLRSRMQSKTAKFYPYILYIRAHAHMHTLNDIQRHFKGTSALMNINSCLVLNKVLVYVQKSLFVRFFMSGRVDRPFTVGIRTVRRTGTYGQMAHSSDPQSMKECKSPPIHAQKDPNSNKVFLTL